MRTEILSNLHMSWNCMIWNAVRNCVEFEDLISWNDCFCNLVFKFSKVLPFIFLKNFGKGLKEFLK